MTPIQPPNDISTVSAFLAMAVKQNLTLNGHTARGAWDAYIRLLGLPQATGSELLRGMLEERSP